MTFDPFGDFETKGYLHNIARAKDRKIVRQIEHAAFTTALDGVFETFAKRGTLTYDNVLATYKSLFWNPSSANYSEAHDDACGGRG